MHVTDEPITFDEAWKRGERDDAFKLKRGGCSPFTNDPSKVKMNGDVIVKADESNNYRHVGGVHKGDWKKYVIGGETVRAERDVYVVGNPRTSEYYGDKGPTFSEKLLKQYWQGYPNMRGHRVLYRDCATNLLNILGSL